MLPYLDESTPPSDYLPTKNAQYKIFHKDGVATVTVDQTGSEVYVGELYIQPGQEQVPLSFSGPVEPTPPKEEIYNSTGIYPKQEEYRISRA